MIVKILRKSSTFKAVHYNTEKVERDRGELLLVQNFGILEGIENLRPKDYMNYLEALSAQSRRTKYPQFHVAISTKGRLHSKEELSTIAQKWMQGMGYGEQPYLLIYHRDTANNHIHIVSSRVGRDGKKISDSYEKLRAYSVMNQILGKNERHALANHLQKALSYSFSTRAQFAMLLEQQGYALNPADDVYKISKYGHVLGEIELAKVDNYIAARQKDKARMAQIRAVIERYSKKYDPKLEIKDSTYISHLANFLNEKFGLQFIFHGKTGQSPHGYTIIDHAEKSVYKGGEIMPLREFIAERNAINEPERNEKKTAEEAVFEDTVKQANSPDLTNNIAKSITSEPDAQMETLENANTILVAIDIHISDDVDDEAMHGRKRRGKQKSSAQNR
ncbi:relaxase/mobilization nuclease domain-containing protein [Sphingobacterium hungaricum]|uniref:MobA/VirD2-like nuclease domain-containing protein n=1 Tax=Sphingobacterium hungaricum TaxID=2082723 RepID=A0A928V0Q3_9SPHI|nr:relaxase/mobilization nuclease domain-containing protein [Sphingobacterium hungaricum]MBE8714831.1 hypothetical protein [Sphingobacterium hungaricum]